VSSLLEAKATGNCTPYDRHSRCLIIPDRGQPVNSKGIGIRGALSRRLKGIVSGVPEVLYPRGTVQRQNTPLSYEVCFNSGGNLCLPFTLEGQERLCGHLRASEIAGQAIRIAP